MLEILLATYNGEKYLKKQLDSILNQTYQDFKILICDDKSNDKTEEIIYKYQKKYPQKIEIIKSEKNLGHCYNFLNLLKYSKDDYVMFCDQDDIWFPQKIEITLREIKKFEDEKIQKAILLHTDQVIIDSSERVINNSSTKYFKKIVEFKSIEEVAFRGGLHGCTMILNKYLLNQLKMKEIWNIDGLIYHDWSISIIAKLIGEILYLNQPTMSYRIHDNNASLTKNIGVLENIKNIGKRIINRRKIFYQYYVLLSIYRKEKINSKKNIYEMNYLERVKFNFKFGPWRYEENYIKKLIKIVEI